MAEVLTPFGKEFARFPTPSQITLDALRSHLTGLLPELWDNQRALLDRMYPKGAAVMSEPELKNAIDLCHRTIAKNRVGREPALSDAESAGTNSHD